MQVCFEQWDSFLVGQASLAWHLKRSRTIPVCNTMGVAVGASPPPPPLLSFSVLGVPDG